jgi:hypothetical protein
MRRRKFIFSGTSKNGGILLKRFYSGTISFLRSDSCAHKVRAKKETAPPFRGVFLYAQHPSPSDAAPFGLQ